jgi:hypothetical protein
VSGDEGERMRRSYDLPRSLARGNGFHVLLATSEWTPHHHSGKAAGPFD